MAIPPDPHPTGHKRGQHICVLLCQFQTYSDRLFQLILTIVHEVERGTYIGPPNMWVFKNINRKFAKKMLKWPHEKILSFTMGVGIDMYTLLYLK